MTRPICDVNGSEYQALLHGRDMYRRYGMDYRDVMWMEDTLDRLKKKLPCGDYTEKDQVDFLKAKEIYTRIFIKKNNEETAENHTITHYIWRTQHDGKIFSWDDLPATGNPGESFGCRCWAEPYKSRAEDTEELQEYVSQLVTYAAPDASHVWTKEDFAYHYFFGNGQLVTLDEIGHLQDVIDCAKTYNQVAAGGGTIFNRVVNQILEAARQKGEGSFSDTFYRWYEFQDFVWSLGGATITGVFFANVVKKRRFLDCYS